MPVPTPLGIGDVFAQDIGSLSGSGVEFDYATILTAILVSATGTFIGAGGTGTAFLEGSLAIIGQASPGGCTYSSSFGSFTQNGCFSSGGFNVPFSVPFTFGQPFTLFAMVTLEDGCGGGSCPSGFGPTDVGLTWEYIGVYDANGNLIPGAAFTQTQTPEGSTPSLVIFGLLFILARGWTNRFWGYGTRGDGNPLRIADTHIQRTPDNFRVSARHVN